MLSNEIPRSALRVPFFSELQRNGFMRGVYADVCLLSPHHTDADFTTPNVQGDRRCAASSRSVPWNEGFGVLGRKLDYLQGFTPLLGVPEVILDLLT
jgi:hypothetical protein